MPYLIWPGAALSLLGIAGILWCIVLVRRARKQGMEDDALRARLQQVVALNLGAFAISALGLAMVVAGIILG
ncbi:MAG: hypothetical protein AAGL98_15225 [Planctomycetota bacterium]